MSDLNPCCILCGSCLLRKNDRNLVDGKGSFVPREELEKLAFVVYSSDACHVCAQELLRIAQEEKNHQRVVRFSE